MRLQNPFPEKERVLFFNPDLCGDQSQVSGQKHCIFGK